MAITASSGDLGFQGPASFTTQLAGPMPADMPGVVSVGGTSLTPHPAVARGWDETVWGGVGWAFASGGGCSLLIPAPSYQTTNYCPGSVRMYPDIVAYADPFEIYVTDNDFPSGAWTYGLGTSLSSPIIAAMYGLAAEGGPAPGVAQLYATAAQAPWLMNDVNYGTNAIQPSACAPYNFYLCNAGIGTDGPSGLGSPSSIGVF